MTAANLRVLVGLESSGPGGAENMVVSLSEGLAARGCEPTIVTDRAGWMTERASAVALPVWIETQRPGLDLGWIIRLARRMRRERIDVFHSHEFSMNVFGGAAAWLARIPHVATIHGRSYVTAAPRRVAAYRWLRRLGVPIVAVSDDLRDFLAQGFGIERDALERIHNGIALRGDAAQPLGSGKADRRAELGIPELPPDEPLILCVGNLYPVKDHATLLRALPRLPGAHVAIAGRGEEEPNLLALAASLGIRERVHLLGLRDDIDRLLAAADVFVQPSRSEGLPLAVLEAMGHGLPIVASRVGGIPEAIEHEVSGLLVPSGDPIALADALREVLESPELAASLARQARQRAEAEFSIDVMVERYAALYRATLRS